MKPTVEYRYEARYRLFEVIALISSGAMALSILISAWSFDDAPALILFAATVICGGGILVTVMHLPRDFAIERRGADLFLLRPGRKPLRIMSHETRVSRFNNRAHVRFASKVDSAGPPSLFMKSKSQKDLRDA